MCSFKSQSKFAGMWKRAGDWLMDALREKLEEEIDRIQTVDLPAWPYDEQAQPVEVVVDGLLLHYRVEGSATRPVWLLVKRMQEQAMVYMNIIDRLKSGE